MVKCRSSGLLLHRRQNFHESRLGLPPGRYLPGKPESLQGIRAGRQEAGRRSSEQYRQPAQFHPDHRTDHIQDRKEYRSADAVNIGRIGHNHVLSVVQLEQIRTIDKQRVIRYFGKIDRGMMKKVESGILVSLGIYRPNRKGESIGTDHDFSGGREDL